MAYGLKYYATAYGLSSVQWKIELLENLYSGSTTELSLKGNGIVIGYDREDNRFNNIFSRYAVIDLKVTNTFDIDSLQFDDERKFQVNVYKNDVLEFIGWLIPFYSSQQFEDTSLAYISIMAKDGVNQLKNKNFVDEHTDVVSNKQSFKDIICQSLRQIGYNLNVEIYYNKYDTLMDKTASDCPLSQLYFNVTSLEDKDGLYIDYYETLQRLLLTHDLRLLQTQGKWVIVSPIELVDGEVSGRKFNYQGTYQSNVTLSTDTVIHTGGLKIKSNSQIRKDIPIQQFSAIYETGLLTNLLSNGKFNNYSGLNPINWTKVGTWNIGEVSTILDSDGIQFNNTFTTSELAEDDKYFESSEIDISGLGSFSFSAEAYADDNIDSVKIAIIIYEDGNESGQKYYVDKYGSIKKYDVTLLIDKGFLSQKVQFDCKFDAGIPSNNTFYIGDSNRLKIRIYPGVKLTSETPTNKKVQFRNLVLTGTARNYDKDFVGRKFEYSNTLLTSSKKEDEIVLYFQGQISGNTYDESRFRNSLFVEDSNNYANSWKRTTESTAYSIVESLLIDRLVITSKFGDIFEGSVKGYINLIETPYITSNSKRFLVLTSEYNLQTDSSEVVLTELYASDITFSAKVYDKFSDGKLVDISDISGSSKIKTNESFDRPITTIGGTAYDPIYADGGIDAIPTTSTDPRATNKGVLKLGGEFAELIELGNPAFDTLTKVLGKLGIKDNVFYDNSKYLGDGTYAYSLGLDTHELMIEGDLEMAGKISVGQGYPIIEKRRGDDGIMKAYIDSSYSPLELVSSNININGVLGVGTIESLDSEPIIVNSPIQFNYDIILGGSAGLDHQFWKYNGLTYEWAYINLGEIQKTTGDENYLIKTGNSTLEKSVIYESSGRIGIGNLATTAAYKLDITGNLHVSSKLYINDDFGSDHKFLKSNGTSQEFAYINLGEIQKTTGDENYLVKTGATTLTKSRLFDNGTFFGIGTSTPITGYDIILNGTSYVNGNLNVHGKLYINESFGTDHQFLKSNGTNNEWAILNTGELEDKLDIVMLVTDEGERGFKMYSDANKTVLEGFVFTDSDTGVFGIHGYRLNGSTTEQYGLQIDKDTFLYHVLPSGVRYRILTTNDNVITGGGGSGTYTASSPLFITQENHNIYIQKATSLDSGYLSNTDWSTFNGKQDVLSNASGSVTGKLTSTDWTTFNNKLDDGDTILDGFNFSSNSNASSSRSSVKFTRSDDANWFGEIFISKGYIPNGLNITSSLDVDAINIVSGCDETAGSFAATQKINLFGSIIAANATDIELHATKYYIYNGATKIEIDMSGFATGKFLKATSSTKAEWI
jgi:hypothetical protein